MGKANSFTSVIVQSGVVLIAVVLGFSLHYCAESSKEAQQTDKMRSALKLEISTNRGKLRNLMKALPFLPPETWKIDNTRRDKRRTDWSTLLWEKYHGDLALALEPAQFSEIYQFYESLENITDTSMWLRTPELEDKIPKLSLSAQRKMIGFMIKTAIDKASSIEKYL